MLLDLRLGLFVEFATHTLLTGGLAGADQLVQVLIAVAGEVGAGLDRRAGKLRREEVVRVAVVTGPAHEQQVMLTGLGAADQFAPFDHADFGLNADFGEVRLQQLGAKAWIGVKQAAGRAGPDGGLESLLESGLGHQALGLGDVVRVTRQTFRVAPGVGRIRTVGRLGSVFEHGFDIVGLVEGKVDGLADFRLVQWRMLTVDADECGHERVSLFDFQGRLFQRFLYVQRLGRQGDLAFIAP
ncbi:hypothetical protein D9M73_165410 [compost metagenome]